MSREQRKAQLIDFLRTLQRPDSSIEALDEHNNLIESCLTDSLSILQIISYVEQTYSIDVVGDGIDPSELVSVANILDLIERKTA